MYLAGAIKVGHISPQPPLGYKRVDKKLIPDIAIKRLKTNNQDWQVNLKIINCHTNKVVSEGTIPKESIKYGILEWNNSY